jgi:predicted Rossmann-fold nucleotide-binding protein
LKLRLQQGARHAAPWLLFLSGTAVMQAQTGDPSLDKALSFGRKVLIFVEILAGLAVIGGGFAGVMKLATESWREARPRLVGAGVAALIGGVVYVIVQQFFPSRV